jgi:hypothetical protein
MTFDLILHGLFAFFEYDDGILIRLPKVSMHHASITLLGGKTLSFTDAVGARLNLTLTPAPSGQPATLFDKDKGYYNTFAFQNREPNTLEKQAYFLDIWVPRPTSITVLDSAGMKPVCWKGAIQPLNPGSTTFAEEYQFSYEINGGPASFSLTGSGGSGPGGIIAVRLPYPAMVVKSGPEMSDMPETHRIKAFQAALKCLQISANDYSWTGMTVPINEDQLPGCSPGGSSGNIGKCGCN